MFREEWAEIISSVDLTGQRDGQSANLYTMMAGPMWSGRSVFERRVGTKRALVAFEEKNWGEMRNEANSDGRLAEAMANKNAVLRIKSLN